MPNVESREARWSVNGAGSAATERECKTERVAALKKKFRHLKKSMCTVRTSGELEQIGWKYLAIAAGSEGCQSTGKVFVRYCEQVQLRTNAVPWLTQALSRQRVEGSAC